jgi:hypothetical protein
MGISGIDTDIISGRPRQVKTREEQQAQEELKDLKAIQEATRLSQDLPAILPIMAGLLEKRLLELAHADGFCQGLFQQANAYNLKVNLAQVVATKIRRQSFGVVLTSMTDETKVAPEGIPTEE